MMNKAFVTVIILMVTVMNIVAQNGFIRTYDHISDYSESLIDIVFSNDTITGVGLSQNNTPPYEFGLVLVNFDTSGNVLNYNHHYSTNHNSFFFQPPSKITNLKNGNYAISGGILSTPLKIYFLEFDKELNIINYFEYLDSSAAYLSTNNLVQINSGFLLFGTVNYLRACLEI